jgi:hypothetical protein
MKIIAITIAEQEVAHRFSHLLGIAADVEAHAFRQFDFLHRLVDVAVHVARWSALDTGVDRHAPLQRLALEHLRAERGHELDHLAQRHHDRIA